MHHNQLTGTIPENLILSVARMFDISGNQIGGEIPQNLVEEIVPSIRHLHLEQNRLYVFLLRQAPVVLFFLLVSHPVFFFNWTAMALSQKILSL